jgi:hypothetical protein
MIAMKSFKELLASFKKQEPKKPEPKPRLDHSLERFVVAQEHPHIPHPQEQSPLPDIL